MITWTVTGAPPPRSPQATIQDNDLIIARTNGLQNGNVLTTDVGLKVNSTLFTGVTNTLDSVILANDASITAAEGAIATHTGQLAALTSRVSANTTDVGTKAEAVDLKPSLYNNDTH